MTESFDKLLDHEYDGIRELDNDLPRWWVWLFYITIIWGVLYFLYYHVADIGYLSDDEYQRELDPTFVRVGIAENRAFGVLSEYRSPFYDPARDHKLARMTAGAAALLYKEETREKDTVTYVALTDEPSIEDGRAIFQRLCFTCHGKLGEGGIGPNLTDDYWLHGAGITSTVKTVKYGYPTKGMLSWRGELKPDQILQVASYVLTLHGTNPPNAKAPQGDLVKEK